MNFTFKAYENLLNLISKKYTIADYQNFMQYENPCILRHDIDVLPDAAIRFAEIESNLGVRATYFILVNTGFYNTSFSGTINTLKRLQSLGHEIGLHFDEMQYSDCDNQEAFKQHVYSEAKTLGNAIDREIRTVSMHRPSRRTLENNYAFDGLINSYSKVFFTDFKYLSDSRMFWREPVENIIESGEYKALHILTHPLWYRESESNIHDILYDFITSAYAERYLLLNENIRDFDEIIKREEI